MPATSPPPDGSCSSVASIPSQYDLLGPVNGLRANYRCNGELDVELIARTRAAKSSAANGRFAAAIARRRPPELAGVFVYTLELARVCCGDKG
jgi:hypothetical protein